MNKWKCIDCEKKVSTKTTTRCRGCHDKYRTGKNCYQYKGGKGSCSECDQPLTQYTQKTGLCRTCYMASWFKKENRPGYKGKTKECAQCEKTFEVFESQKRKYCSRECGAIYRSKYYRADKIYNYKEDRSQLISSDKKHLDGRYKGWMRAVKNRDGWCCKINNKDCNGRLEAHHILRWSTHPELRYEVNNGIALCHFHHPLKIKDEMKLVPTFRELINVK